MTNLFKKIAALAVICAPLFAGAQTAPKQNWQNMDLKTDSVYGISTEKAYTELLKDKKHVPVVVAVIDGGVDINHEDLKSIIWTNPKEKAGNQKDDDKNGYADDIHGWDFIGGAKGDVHYDNLEVVRQVRALKPKYENADTTKLSAADLAGYHKYVLVKADLDKQLADAQKPLAGITHIKVLIDSVLMDMKNPNPTLADLKAYTPKTPGEKQGAWVMTANYQRGNLKDYNEFKVGLQQALDHYSAVVNYHLNINFNSRDTVGDDYSNSDQRDYGNNDVTGPDAMHGSHVAGIIGAVRDNNIGAKGVANDVLIMSVRTVPDGDERDKDVANAIRYAAANGAKVINMSFGKPYASAKKEVDDAIKFAASKDVLIIHASGNDNKDLDQPENFNYPNKYYLDGGSAANWIEIGASGPNDNETLKAPFSNYGQKNVDVFAPGVSIYSTVPSSKYASLSGTSMATPVVAGLAALIRSYYPKLTAVQVKEIILKSATKVNHDVTVPGKKDKVPFASLCQTGAIVNAYAALQLAATY